MDPYSSHAIATSRRADLLRAAEESRVAEAAREDERPAPEPSPRPVRARRLRIAG